MIIESGMTFGPYPDGHYFHIEKSLTYQNIRDHGVRIAEFLLLRFQENKPTAVWIVEAKSSSPHPITRPNFDSFIREIREKFTNTLSLYLAMHLKRHKDTDELPEPFKALNLSTADFRLVLVVNAHKEDWLGHLKDAVVKALHPVIKTWALDPLAVIVLNDSMARKCGLVDVGMK